MVHGKGIRFTLILLVGITSAPSSALWSQAHRIDTGRSIMTVRVFKSGLFSPFADNHEIQAPISSGFLDKAGHRIELIIDARKLMVLDPDLSPQKREQVQQRMLGPEVLDSDHFPGIRFEGNNIRQTAQNQFLVSGTLSLHGRTQPISVAVIRSNGRYHGSAVLKQRDFGITPVKIAGGTVRVKNEVRIEFDIAEARGEPGETKPSRTNILLTDSISVLLNATIQIFKLRTPSVQLPTRGQPEESALFFGAFIYKVDLTGYG